jgi:hypothetical protein
MNVITIRFTHAHAQQPKYTFGSRVAIKNTCDSREWATGIVTGLQLDDYLNGTWNYTVVFDCPQGYCEELAESELISENEIVCLT